MKIPVCVALIISIWIVSISVSLPLAVYQEVSWIPAEEIYVCREAWPHPAARKFFTVASLILQYIIPCSLIIFCYARVSIALNRRARALVRRGMRTKATSERHQMAIDRKRRTNRMLIAMVVIFVLCWLPLNVILLILEYHEDLEKWSCFLLTFFTAHVTAMSSTIYNPFLYAWMNENFQTEFRRVLPCLISSGRVVKRPTQTGVSISLYSVMESQVPLQRTLYATPKVENGSSPGQCELGEGDPPESDVACHDDDEKQTRDQLEFPVETMKGNSVR